MLALSARLWAPEVEVKAIGFGPVSIVLRLEGRLVRVRLGRAEAHVAHGQRRLVEAVVEAAELKAVVERIADRRVARELLVDEVELALRLPHAGDVVLVGVAGRNVVEVGIRVLGAGHRRDERQAVAPRGDREVVGYAVLVDVAEVVLGIPFLREHRLRIDRYVRLVLGRGGREICRRRLGLGARLFWRKRKRPLGRAALGLRRGDEPGVEEAVLLCVGIGVVAGGHVGGHRLRRARAVLGYREVLLVVQPAVVERANAIAPRIHVNGRRRRAVPPQAPAGTVGERRIGDVEVAFAATALEGRPRIFLREVAVAEPGRPVRNRSQELGRPYKVHVRPRLDAAVLVLDRQGDGLVLLARAEVRDERAAPLVSVGDVEGRLVVAALERHLDAGAFARGPDCREVVIDVAADFPADRIRIRRAAGNDPRVRVFERDVAELGRHVVDVDLRLVWQVVLGPRHRRVGRGAGRDDLRPDGEALGARQARAVHGIDADRNRLRGVEDHVVLVVGKRRIARRNRLELVVKDERSRVGPRGRRNSQLDDDVVLGIEVPEPDVELGANRVFVIRRLGNDRDRGLGKDDKGDGVGHRRPSQHVLVLDLDLDRPDAGAREVVDERTLVDVHAVGH